MKYCDYCMHRYNPRRSDQKYCSDRCRNTYKNARVREEKIRNEVFEPAMKIIRKNYKVLIKFLNFPQPVRIEYLRNHGFNPDYFTNFYTNGIYGEEWRCCGKVMFLIAEDRREIFIHWKEENHNCDY